MNSVVDSIPTEPASDTPSMGEAAMDYAALGWFVVALNGVYEDGSCRCPKARTCGSAGKHPVGRLLPRGWRDASRYGPTVARWWRMCPGANVGIVTGPSGLASLDVDPRNGGDDGLDVLIDQHGPLPETLHLRTGGGGSQFIFSDPDRTVAKHTPLPGIDILGGGCLFVAAPSHHKSGGAYSWANWGTDPVAVPTWMRRDQP